ncbi:hypothetical protein GCM10008959_09900 [Deinococcus seoulensis]|uniref:Uncharacterized protein n=2 Tax=Deinococcus TaxID=1298 RepID=A0ABQ2RPZ1_9DEIO|nr:MULTISPECIES: hypothetical protein [Deinococcus]GGR50645.1 hypothetical protein GCM10008959_09900 [Deinococcus seoulensis]GGS31983.1 hypothetical protein GCM10008961_24630 [Deinococcus knuensis]
MTRLLLALAGVILLAVTALALVWLIGQVLVGLGAVLVGAVGVLGRLLWFLLVTGLLAGLVYFVTSAWRPALRARGGSEPARPASVAPVRLEKPPVTPDTSA